MSSTNNNNLAVRAHAHSVLRRLVRDAVERYQQRHAAVQEKVHEAHRAQAQAFEAQAKAVFAEMDASAPRHVSGKEYLETQRALPALDALLESASLASVVHG